MYKSRLCTKPANKTSNWTEVELINLQNFTLIKLLYANKTHKIL